MRMTSGESVIIPENFPHVTFSPHGGLFVGYTFNHHRSLESTGVMLLPSFKLNERGGPTTTESRSFRRASLVRYLRYLQCRLEIFADADQSALANWIEIQDTLDEHIPEFLSASGWHEKYGPPFGPTIFTLQNGVLVIINTMHLTLTHGVFIGKNHISVC